MITQGHYLVDEKGSKVFYVKAISNPVYYALSLTCTPLPTTLPAGWANPGIDLTAAAGNCPQLVVPEGSSKLLGFAAGSYPPVPQTSIYQVNSGVPQITDATSYNILCDAVDNSGWSLSPNILYSFTKPISIRSGDPIQLEPHILQWVPISAGQNFQTISVRLVDQLMRPVEIHDIAGFVLTLSLRRRRG